MSRIAALKSRLDIFITITYDALTPATMKSGEPFFGLAAVSALTQFT
jgi:hypothetical protein